jgi:NADPH:quinone reductase-like Zn-dependent oxidoreductase
MKALLLESVNSSPVYKEVEKPKPAEKEVLVKIAAAALNHRDIYISQGLYPGIVTPIILGSDGAGTVLELGVNVGKEFLNREVIINPNINWGANPKVQDKKYNILGMPSNGTLAEYVCVNVDRLSDKPAHLNFAEAASIPLAGLTAYRSLFTKAALQKGERLLISGIGGGVALTAFQMALAIGAEVWVSSGTDDKIEQAVKLGAKGGINYKTENWHKELEKIAGGGFDVILDSAGGEGFQYFLDLANPAGRIVFYGGTRGSFKVNPQKMFWKQLTIFGSTMGDDHDFDKMISLFKDYQIIPFVKDIRPLSDGAAAFKDIDEGRQFGKLVLIP